MGLFSVKVVDIMTRSVLSVTEETQLGEVARRMVERNVGCAVVVDREGRCVGIITERDFLRLFSENVPSTRLVGEYMSKNPITVREDESVNQAKNIMITQKIRHLPVIDYHGKVVGILSMRDVFERIETLI